MPSSRRPIAGAGAGAGVGAAPAAEAGEEGAAGQLHLRGAPVEGETLSPPMGGVVDGEAAAAAPNALGAASMGRRRCFKEEVAGEKRALDVKETRPVTQILQPHS